MAKTMYASVPCCACVLSPAAISKAIMAAGATDNCGMCRRWSINNGRYKCSIQAIDRRQPGDHGIGHALGNEHDAHGNAGHHIISKISLFIGR